MTGRAIRWVVVWTAAALFVALAWRTERRVDHDAQFCTTSCHHDSEHARGIPQTSGHRDVECQQCHRTSLGDSLTLAWQAMVGSGHPIPHGRQAVEACTECHERKRPAEWRLIAETAGHREHRGAKDVDCLSCHASGIHETKPPEAVCTTCHQDQRLHKTDVANAETCLTCHSYTATPARLKEPTTVACERCHASEEKLAPSARASGGAGSQPLKDINEHVLHGGVACQLCHNAHGKEPKPPEGQPVCARCHQFENFQASGEERKGPEGHRNCEGCHKPHAPLKTALQRCVSCHEKNAKGINATGTGNTSALKHESCASCHLPHTWRAERSGCMQCHKDKAQLILTRSPPQHDQCTQCHDVHGPPPTGSVCLNCHANTKGKHVALAPEKHKDCTSCHNPHAPLPQDTRVSCAKCHADKVTQVMRDGPDGHARDTCYGCHQPHNDPRPPPSVCGKCHQERALVVAAAGPPKHRVCTGCHADHKFRVTDIKSTCARCHGAMFTTDKKVPHDGDCKSCHAVHGSPGVAKSSCLQCHEKVAHEFNPPNDKHGVCRSCHEPHKPASTALAKCAGCHQAKAEVAAKWPPNSAHAQACNGCHQQHDVRKKKVCADCHSAETQSAVGGKHQCVQCHAPHRPPPGNGHAWWQKCNECHANKVASTKERGPTHADCASCHKPHKFAVPSCTSCHNMAGRGLHQVEKHAANCTSCHDPHVKGPPTREQCLSCHTNRMNHETKSQRCQACHMFR